MTNVGVFCCCLKAQKPWTKKLLKVEKFKKDYHNACKAVKTAVTQENNAKNSSEMSADQVSMLFYFLYLSKTVTFFVQNCDIFGKDENSKEMTQTDKLS